MVDDLKEYGDVRAAMLAFLEGISPGDRPPGSRLVAYEEFPATTQLAAWQLAKSAGFVADGTLTWQGYEHYMRARHPVRYWWCENWFPAIVAIVTILAGGAVAATSVLTFLGFGHCPGVTS